MDNNKINKIGLCFLIGLGLWGGGTFIKDFFINQPKLREKGGYTIGYIYKYRKRLKGADISYYKYNVRNKLWYGSTIDGESEELIHKRFLVKYVEGEYLSKILLEYPVPDSIKKAPPEGWKKMPEWAVETIISNSDWW